MRKTFLSCALLAALLGLFAGCALAKPEYAAGEEPFPAGIWLEPAAAAGYEVPETPPVVDFDAPGALGLILKEERVNSDGTVTDVLGRQVTPQFMEVRYSSNVHFDGGDAKTESTDFSGTLYLNVDGSAPENFRLWWLYPDGEGGYEARGQSEYIHISAMQLREPGTYSRKFSKTRSLGYTGEEKETEGQSYSIGFAGIGRLAQVRLVELDKDFRLLRDTVLEIEDGDAYRLRADTAYVNLVESYDKAGAREEVCTAYSRADGIDYDGEQALYHSLRYMGENGVVVPRGLKIIFS